MGVTKREKILLSIIQKSPGLSKLRLVKLTFLISLQLRKNKRFLYSFVPYKYGPFSFQLYHDLYRLEQAGLVTQYDTSVKLVSPSSINIDGLVSEIIESHIDKFRGWSDSELVRYVYENYPEYTNYESIINGTREPADPCIVTIGYEGRTIDEFLNEMITQGVDIVLDVRKNAFSRKFGFSKSKLLEHLGRFGIEYRHIPELGIDSASRRNLKSYDDYQMLFIEYEKELKSQWDTLIQMKQMSDSKRIALLCFERDHHYCHRGVIAKQLEKLGAQVIHI